ncbi:hypothetical protein [Mesobacterium pallidum]|uniref:hypothetical protein n=1 Tax=Mesobacterium pallidum TaxID=2872037 RepID=UPI001EE2946D|nr:hypothetical protein [Mesobacterium pallidum]
MEFESEEAFEAWLKEQSQEVCVAIATRAASRAWPNVTGIRFWKTGEDARKAHRILALLTGWALLTAAVAAVRPTPEVKSAASAARFAASAASAASAAFASASAARFASASAASASAASAASAARFAAAAASAASASAARFAAAAASAASAAFFARFAASAASAIYSDAGLDPETLFALPVWHEAGTPEGLRLKHVGDTLLDTDPAFAFFARWYRGMVEGKPLPWDLQERVALIDPKIWEQGPEAVAAEIEKIVPEWRKEQAANANRAPEFEPPSVQHLFEAPRAVSAGAISVAYSITQGFEAFRAETGLNETPETLVPLEAVPLHLRRIADILREGDRSPEIEQQLREEIGRLNKRIEELTAALDAANKQVTDLSGQKWKKVAAGTAIAWGVVGTLATAVWTVSGDEVGARQRVETLQEYRNVFQELYGETMGPDYCIDPGP